VAILAQTLPFYLQGNPARQPSESVPERAQVPTQKVDSFKFSWLEELLAIVTVLLP
jgi:hypothetical protein